MLHELRSTPVRLNMPTHTSSFSQKSVWPLSCQAKACVPLFYTRHKHSKPKTKNASPKRPNVLSRILDASCPSPPATPKASLKKVEDLHMNDHPTHQQFEAGRFSVKPIIIVLQKVERCQHLSHKPRWYQKLKNCSKDSVYDIQVLTTIPSVNLR